MAQPSLSRLATLILQQAPDQGFQPSRLAEVILMRSDQVLRGAATVYEPCVVIVAQGRKAMQFGGRRKILDASRCFMVTLPIPFKSETYTDGGKPFLALAVSMSPSSITNLLLEMDTARPNPAMEESTGFLPMDDELLAVAVRLMEALSQDESARVLGPGIVRELTYLLLRRPGTEAMRDMAAAHARVGRIASVIRRMHASFDEAHDVPSMAREAGMGISTFHSHFKALTGETPLQYLKLIRLHRARSMMVNEGLSAQATAALVGYESPSQFSREFKRVFGGSPGAVSAQLRSQLASGRASPLRSTLSFELPGA